MSVVEFARSQVRNDRASVSIGLLGYGRVGQAVARLASGSADRLTDAGIGLRLAAALVRDVTKPREGQPGEISDDPAAFFAHRFDVVIEVIGGVHPAYEYVRRALEHRIPVVTANKSLMAAKGEELRDVARRHGVPLVYDAAVLAGVPFIGALSRRPFIRSPKRLTGILNGTSHFLTCSLANGGSFEAALAEAIRRGYAEPDSSADVSGRDAAEKLTILLHLAGCAGLQPTGITTLGLDAVAPVDFKAACAVGGVIKPIATASLDSETCGAWVGPALVDAQHPVASSRGVFNFLELQADASIPVTFSGSGAGPGVTAATILDDVAEVLAGRWNDERPAQSPGFPSEKLRHPPAGSWYVRVRSASVSLEEFAEHLVVYHVPAVRLARVDDALVARTIAASWESAQVAADMLCAIGADVLLLPVVEATQ